jgi:hypothetical protein
VGGVAAGFVDHIGEHVGAEGGQPFAGDRVTAQSLGKGLVGGLEFFGVGGCPHFHAVVIQDDGLDAFGSHDGAHATASGMAGGTLFHIREGDGCGGHLHLTGLADGDAGHFLAILGGELFHGGVVAQSLEIFGGFQFDAVFVDDNLVKAVVRCFPFEDDGCIAQPAHHLGPLAAGVGLLDAAGERAFAAHADPAGNGRGRTAEQARCDDQFIGVPQGWQVGGTSLDTIAEVIARPPNPA